MRLKQTLKYSPNFDLKKRSKNKIRFLVFHYTGMKSDTKALNKHSIGIEVSNPGHQYNYKDFSKKQIRSIINLSKYLIKKYNINYKNILGHSDIAPIRKKDPGEKFPWSILAKNKIGVWHSLPNLILKNNRLIKTDHKDNNYFVKNLLKIGYTFKNSKGLKKNLFLKLLIKAFQEDIDKN